MTKKEKINIIYKNNQKINSYNINISIIRQFNEMFIFTNAMKYCKIITASEYEFSSRNASIYYNDAY